MSTKIEILAPAGSYESIAPAVLCGADAIYLGGENFSARGNAANFNRDQLIKTVDFCHKRNVKVYVTLNTLIFDNEIENALSFIKFLCLVPVDALIVQDLGLISLIKKVAPDMPLHASTQMSIHTLSGIQALHELGFKRVVLARELSFNEIKEIAKESPIELEVFVHGALCMSVSGQCYMSAMIGGRSGNRGFCAQPCRLPHKTKGSSDYALSLKDLSLIDYIKELSSLGVTSAKIEGRMKRPEYVAASVAACRSMVDNETVDKNLIKNLQAVFSRSGFTDGYYQGQPGQHMFGIREKENVLSATKNVFSQIHDLYKSEQGRIPVDFKLTVKANEPLMLAAEDKFGNSTKALGQVPETAKNISLSQEKCIAQLRKTGGTQFFSRNINCEIEPGLSVSNSQLNLLRRECLTAVEKQIKNKYKKISFNETLKENIQKHISSGAPKIRARFNDTNIPKEFSQCEIVYVPINSSIDEIKRLQSLGINVALEIPRGMFGIENFIKERLALAKQIGVKDVWAGNIGSVKLAREYGFNIHGGFSLNVCNTYSVEFIKQLGITDIELSFEMTFDQIKNLGSNVKRGIIGYGRVPLMLMRNCPAATGKSGCRDCNSPPTVIDRKKIKFPIICNNGCSEMLNSVPIYLGDKSNEFCNLDFIVLRFTVENFVEKVEKLKSFNNHVKETDGFTRGLYYRGVN